MNGSNEPLTFDLQPFRVNSVGSQHDDHWNPRRPCSAVCAFAAGRTPREAMYGRQAAERYLAGRLSYEYTQAYLKQYDAEIARMNKRMPHSDDERLLAKRRSKLSVRLVGAVPTDHR